MTIRALLTSILILILQFNDLSGKIIAVTDRNISAGLSPYNWVCRDGYVSSSVCGASVIVKFKGTSQVALQVSTGHMIFESPNRFPIIAWTVNGGAVQTHQLRAGEVSVKLSDGIADPLIDLYIKGLSPFEDRYSGNLPPNALKIAGFMVDEGGSAEKATSGGKHWLTIGDSILSGDGAALETDQGRPADDLWAASDDSRASYGHLLARYFGFSESRLAFGGYDWGGGMAGVPALRTLIDSITSTSGRIKEGKLDPIPDVVMINLGENGAPAEKDVTDALMKLRSRVSTGTKIIIMVPVSGRARSAVTKAFNAYQSASADKSIYLVDLGFFGFATCDGQHPSASGHKTIYKAALPAFEAILQGQYISPVTIPLWTGTAPESQGSTKGKDPLITIYRPVKPNGAAVVICPGGGYGMLVTGPEGQGIAQWLNKKGITAIVLEYRLPRGNSKVPLLDAQQAIRLVRSMAPELKLDPNRIGIIGFSAGGHLASTTATHFDQGDKQSADPVARFSCRPDFAILVYPVVTMGPDTHGGSRNNLLGQNPSPDLINLFSNEKQVNNLTPPTFLAHAQDDDVVKPSNSQLFYDALITHNIPAFYLKLPSGSHGLNGYSGPMWEEWQAKSLQWLAELKMIPATNISVIIDEKKSGQVISPLLFGHNLEVTRRGFWSGLSAQMLANRKFAAVADNMPKQWSLIGAGGSFRIDTTMAYAGKQSLRIEGSGKGVMAGVSQQQEQLAVQKDRNYALRIWVKTENARKLRVSFAGNAAKPFFEKTFSCKRGDWQLISTVIKAPETRADCIFEISSGETGTFWVGAVSLMPADNFHGMRRDVVEQLKMIKPGILRFPGGCYAEFYSWKDGLLPVDQRPPIVNTGLDFLFRNTDDTDTHEIGIDEFAALCRELACEAVLTVRLSENTPDDAADWVQYCNGDAGTKWGDVRISRGHKEPYHIGWWFVGNELYSFGRGAARGIAGCTDQTTLFSMAMKNIDPNIRLVPSTLYGGDDPARDWNLPLLKATGSLTDAVSAHQYILDRYPLKSLADYSMIIRSPQLNTLPMLRNTRRFIDEVNPDGKKLGILYDEWNTRWGLSGTIPMGIYAASMLNMLCRESGALGLEMACFFMPVNEGAIKVSPLSAELDAAGQVFELFKVHQANKLLALPENSEVDLCASLNSDGSQINITLVNGIIGQQTVEFSFTGQSGFESSKATVRQLVPLTLNVEETVFKHQDEEVQRNKDGKFVVHLHPGGIALLTIYRLYL